ncbi:flagellar biosynthetic protein FliR [Acetobacteraceae bacterium ESL0709]|nr:flagellar biosynthetic protein FliR [Acetobacteraceae bacterium ESL0697]MDF7679033.1 flagellar biosynthetic protein FliR [Acetobacteraceae bacterium ESL0709]
MSVLSDFFGSPNLGDPNGSIAILMGTFLIILCRVGAIVMTAPGLGERDYPVRIRAGLALAVTVAVLPVLQEKVLAVSGEVIRMPFMAMAVLAEELLCGIFIGLLARLIAMSLIIAAQMISIFTGLASVIQVDSDLGASSTAVAHLTNALLPVVFLTSGLYALPLLAISGSYAIFPAGHITAFMVGDMTMSLTETVTNSFHVAMQLASPFILVGTLWPAMLGVLNRLMPAIQVYGIAMPAQILGGIFLFALLIQVIVGTWSEKTEGLLLVLPGLTAPASSPL